MSNVPEHLLELNALVQFCNCENMCLALMSTHDSSDPSVGLVMLFEISVCCTELVVVLHVTYVRWILGGHKVRCIEM